MTSEGFQYRAVYKYKPERGDDPSLQPGDLLTVPHPQDGNERSPRGWLHGTKERTMKPTWNFCGVCWSNETPSSCSQALALALVQARTTTARGVTGRSRTPTPGNSCCFR